MFYHTHQQTTIVTSFIAHERTRLAELFTLIYHNTSKCRRAQSPIGSADRAIDSRARPDSHHGTRKTTKWHSTTSQRSQRPGHTNTAKGLIQFQTQSHDPISCQGKPVERTMKSPILWFHWPAPLVSGSDRSDRRTKSESGSGPSEVMRSGQSNLLVS